MKVKLTDTMYSQTCSKLSFPRSVRYVAMSSKNMFDLVKCYSLMDYWTKWPVGIWAPPLWSMLMFCKLDTASSNLYAPTGPNVHWTSIYLSKTSSLGQRKSGLIRQVTYKKRFKQGSTMRLTYLHLRVTFVKCE